MKLVRSLIFEIQLVYSSKTNQIFAFWFRVLNMFQLSRKRVGIRYERMFSYNFRKNTSPKVKPIKYGVQCQPPSMLTTARFPKTKKFPRFTVIEAKYVSSIIKLRRPKGGKNWRKTCLEKTVLLAVDILCTHHWYLPVILKQYFLLILDTRQASQIVTFFCKHVFHVDCLAEKDQVNTNQASLRVKAAFHLSVFLTCMFV